MIFVCLSKAVEADKPRLPVTITSPLARDVRANPSSLRGLCENSISCHSCSVMIPAARYRCRWQQLGTEPGTGRTATALVNSRSDISLLWLWTNHHKLSVLKHHKLILFHFPGIGSLSAASLDPCSGSHKAAVRPPAILSSHPGSPSKLNRIVGKIQFLVN